VLQKPPRTGGFCERTRKELGDSFGRFLGFLFISENRDLYAKTNYLKITAWHCL
jgi:hypothetical protein